MFMCSIESQIIVAIGSILRLVSEYKMRIFPKSKARWEGEFVHERLTFDKSMDITHLKGHLEHYSYYNTKSIKSGQKSMRY